MNRPVLHRAFDQFEEHLKLLINEGNQRMKNSLANVQSTAAQALRDMPLADRPAIALC